MSSANDSVFSNSALGDNLNDSSLIEVPTHSRTNTTVLKPTISSQTLPKKVPASNKSPVNMVSPATPASNDLRKAQGTTQPPKTHPVLTARSNDDLDTAHQSYLGRIHTTVDSHDKSGYTKKKIADDVKADVVKVNGLYKEMSKRARHFQNLYEQLKKDTDAQTKLAEVLDSQTGTSVIPQTNTAELKTLLDAVTALTAQHVAQMAVVTALATSVKTMSEQITDIQARPPPTYASMAMANRAPQTPRTARHAKSTPGPSFSLVVWAVDRAIPTKDVKDLIEKKVNFRELKFGVKMTSLSNNAVKLKLDTIQQRDTVINKINDSQVLTAEISKKKNPMMILKGVPKDFEQVDLIGCITEQNEAVNQATNGIVDSVKFRFKRDNRKDTLVNYVIEVSPDVRKAMLAEGRISIGSSKVHVEDFSTFLQCFRCFGFGHTTQHCKTQQHDTCGHCSGQHRFSDCTKKADKSAMKCINCLNANAKNGTETSTSHVPQSKSCPHVKKMMKRASEMTEYGN